LLLDHGEAVEQRLANLIQSTLNVGEWIMERLRLQSRQMRDCNLSDQRVRAACFANTTKTTRGGLSHRVLRLAHEPLGRCPYATHSRSFS